MYDALDEYHVRKASDDMWQRLLRPGKIKVHANDIPHNVLVSLKKMELIKTGEHGFVFLTPQGRQYAQLQLDPPF